MGVFSRKCLLALLWVVHAHPSNAQNNDIFNFGDDDRDIDGQTEYSMENWGEVGCTDEDTCVSHLKMKRFELYVHLLTMIMV
jgi:hypothetical protein